MIDYPPPVYGRNRILVHNVPFTTHSLPLSVHHSLWHSNFYRYRLKHMCYGETETIMIVVILSIMADKSMESNSAFILFWKLKKRPTTWYIFTSVILKTILSSWWTGTLLQKIYSNKEVESVKNTFVIFRPIILKKRSGFVNNARNIARFLRPLFKHHHFLDNKVAAKKLKRATT